MARRRFVSLEKRLSRNSEIEDLYKSFMTEYEKLGHMEEVKKPEKSHYYFPHHYVLKPDSSSTKLRVVFDGSAKTTSSLALNDILAVGPVVQNELASIILRYRSYKYAIHADIEKMFRQIWVHPSDQQYQYIFWRNNESEEMKTYKLKTVTYGTTSAPFLSTRCLLQLALDCRDTQPLASSSIQNDIYVDDWLSGSDTVEGALKLKEEVASILSSAGMILRKWCSNDDRILYGVAVEDRESFIHFDESDFVKTLGIYWNSSQDIFRFNIPQSESKSVTKRVVASEVARIYDPIGLVSPIVIVGKLFLQKLWGLKVNWDESLPLQFHSEWSKFRLNLIDLNHVQIPRYIFDDSSATPPTKIQLHGFCDASERGYGAAIYIRSELSSNQFCTKLLCSRSRVAPLKKLTLPRLELTATSLLSRLIQNVRSITNIKIDELFCWTDSTITLHWIKSDSSKWQTFVSNRIAAVQKVTSPDDWYHVSSKNNPADLISRGVTPAVLNGSNLWWNGPQFLAEPDSSWKKPFPSTIEEDVPEMKKCPAVLAAMKSDVADVLECIKFRDNFLRFRRVVAFALRFVETCKRKSHLRQKKTYSPENVWRKSLLVIVKLSQQVSFPDEYAGLQCANFIIRHPKLRSLNLFIDQDGIVRVGGRIEMADLPYGAKHPALLGKNHYFTLMIFHFFHRQNFHIGPQGLLAIVRQNYFPLNGRIIAKNVCKNCVTCFRSNPKPLQQQMGNLPEERVKMAPCFYQVGVDYCGPFLVHHHVRGKVPTKTYLAVFVCFTTKAIHLEVALDLSADSFMGVFKRFVAARGKPSRVVSDNGTNFVGARRELSEMFDMLRSTSLATQLDAFCDANEISWSFAPPSSPHFGGLYEAAVKSAKTLLKKMMTTASLNYDEFHTLVKQIEAILNSRPLIPIPSDEHIAVLTPGHFLVGRPLVAIPEPGFVEDNISALKRWRLVQALHKLFWSKWSTEYLQLLHHRYFWQKPAKNIEINRVVLVKDDNLPPLAWKLAKVVETHPGDDGRVRVVTLKTGNGTIMKRPIVKICPLPLPEEVDHTCAQEGEDVNASNN